MNIDSGTAHHGHSMELTNVNYMGLAARGVKDLREYLSKLPQYEPETEHFFHGGMYCRKVWRQAGVSLVGGVHKSEHFYLVVYGRLLVTEDDKPAKEVVGGTLMLSRPGARRSVLSLEPTLCMTFHRTDATTVEEAEAELVEHDPDSMYAAGNKVKPGILKYEPLEVLS